MLNGKSYNVEIQREKLIDGGRITIQRNAEIMLDADCTMAALLDWLTHMEKITQCYRAAARVGDFVKLSVFISKYNDGEQTSFDCWGFNGYPDDLEGIYLTADTRYTAAEKDIYISFDGDIQKNIMDALGNY